MLYTTWIAIAWKCLCQLTQNFTTTRGNCAQTSTLWLYYHHYISVSGKCLLVTIHWLVFNSATSRPNSVSVASALRRTFTETKMSSFWWNFHHWLHWKLSVWQLSVQPVMKISSKWRHFRFSVGAWTKWPTFCTQHFQFHFLEENIFTVIQILIESYSHWPN